MLSIKAKWKNGVDRDQMAMEETDLELQCFRKRINLGSAGQGF